jgi:regulator of replication initiation timing
MPQFEKEEDMLEAISQVVEENTGLALNTDYIKELLVEVQREQLKGVVYRAFMAVNQAKEENPPAAEESKVEENGAG